ncbi:helix-turn-helix transcriptional regulator [Haliangium sp.]|uniref:helix-turn-helix transcriptional regulator n=1 Tax=Haliangium sp. TaxID=2663208 RepID=UPI003D109445
MAAVRPIPRDQLAGSGASVVARWQAPDESARPCRRPVTHTHAALAFYTGGRSRVEQNGRWDLAAGDVHLVPAGQPHRSLESRRPEFWGLAFCVSCFAGDGAETLLGPFERVRDGASAVVRIPTARHAFLDQLFRELAGIAGHGQRSAEAQAAVQRSLLTLILNEVDRAASWADHGLTAASGVVVDSLRFIERNCLRRLTLGDVAAAVGRSPAYVTSALSRATGRSAGEWILTGRMAEARRLLVHSDELVDVIAERVGYADTTHFIRMFRREHGATPAAWRAAQVRAAGATGASGPTR